MIVKQTLKQTHSIEIEREKRVKVNSISLTIVRNGLKKLSKQLIFVRFLSHSATIDMVMI